MEEFEFIEEQPDDSILGLSIILVSENKIPLKPWKGNQYISETEIWHDHLINERTVGIRTGQASVNLECIDVDVKNDPNRSIMTEFSDLIPDEILQRLIIQTTPNNGFHLIYRCLDATIGPSQKLALHSDKSVIIETRGEGAYFCSSLKNNKILQGTFDLLHLNVEIPIISAKERELLLELARSLTRYFATINDDKASEKTNSYSEPAINEFNIEFVIQDLFIRHNWSVIKEDDQKVYLKRDGSSAAYSGYYFKEKKTFICFSTSTEFTPGKPYNHFQVLQVLEGKNDYKSTLRLLPLYGFSPESKPDKITTDDIANYLNSQGVRYDSFIQDITLNGKIIEEREYNTLFIDLKKKLNMEISRQRFEETIKSNYIQTIHPIEDFVEVNMLRHPVGTFERWLECMVLKNKSIDKANVVYFLKKWYVGMIAQAMDGEFPNEFFLTLISTEQGIGKTTLLRKYTLPIELYCYRKEHALSFDEDFKVLMSQSLLIIDDELDGRTYEADKTFKTVLSSKEPTTRRKYDRRISTMKRRCSFAGSGNNLSIIREQQNRRIIPIEIEKIHFDKLAAIDYTDLFMEAYNLFVNGFKYSYQHSDREMLNQLFADYLQMSDVDLIIDEYLQKPQTIGETYYMPALELVIELANKFPMFQKRINLPTIGKIMSDKGYESARKGKQRTTCYAISKDSKLLKNDDSGRSLSIEPLGIAG
jgi:hypothetical protein